MKSSERSKIGKQNRQKGQRFEVLVRKDFEKKRWIISRWGNNVDFSPCDKNLVEQTSTTDYYGGRLVPAKSTRFRSNTHGFPDFIAYKMHNVPDKSRDIGFNWLFLYEIIGVECKINGYLKPEEKEKCKWLLDNNKFSKILIASKGEKRGEIVYNDFQKIS